MQTNLRAMRKYDAGLIFVTIVAAVGFISVLLSLSPITNSNPKYSQLSYLKETEGEALNFRTVTQKSLNEWQSASSPINLGMDTKVHWFSMIVSPTQSTGSRYLLHIDYPLIDHLDVAVFNQLGSSPVVTYASGDAEPFDNRPILHVKPLFPLPESAQSQRIIIRVQTSGTIRLPIRIWEEA